MVRCVLSLGFSLTFAVFAVSAPAPEKERAPRFLRVLLFAGSPTREYQFLRSLLIKESERKHVALSILLQPPPGREKRRPGVDQGVPAERLLDTFPAKLDAYDAIVAFDPDWTLLSGEAHKSLRDWVREKGGGLISIAGPINARQLVGKDADRKLDPLLDLLPVVLGDPRLLDRAIDTSKPRRLIFPQTEVVYPFLRLNGKVNERTAGWRDFFDQKNPGETRNGFYSYYPVASVKPSGVVLAALDDDQARGKDGKDQPFLVMGDARKGRVVYLGSGEIWRLRQHRREYYERFWLTLLGFATEPRP